MKSSFSKKKRCAFDVWLQVEWNDIRRWTLFDVRYTKSHIRYCGNTAGSFCPKTIPALWIAGTIGTSGLKSATLLKNSRSSPLRRCHVMIQNDVIVHVCRYVGVSRSFVWCSNSLEIIHLRISILIILRWPINQYSWLVVVTFFQR